jgi:hypothetical protein
VERIHKQARPPEADAGRVADDYDRIADEYAKRIYDELDGKPFDRELLAALHAAGFAIEQIASRARYAAVEVETSRLYVRAVARPATELRGHSYKPVATSR